MIDTTARNVGLQDLVAMLQEQQVRKVDMVVPASRMRSTNGNLVIDGVDPILMDDGVLDANGTYRPTGVFDEGVADRLGIPLAYVRRLRAERPDLMDANVNGWLHGYREYVNADGPIPTAFVPGDTRSFLARCFRGDDGEPGIARALLSDRFSISDNLDSLMAVLDGARAAGIQTVVDTADITERRMTFRLVAPEVQTLAERLLEGYRNPFGADFERWRSVADREGLGYGGSEPVIFAGLRFSNSETGNGAWSITPEMVVKVCANGLTLTKHVVREVHLGGRMDAGVVRWSAETMEKNLDLVRAKTADAVKTFLDVDFMEAEIAKITEQAEKSVADHDEVKVIAKRAKFTDGQITDILSHFTRGGVMTRGGIMQAVTSVAQIVPDADLAYEMQNKALSVLTA